MLSKPAHGKASAAVDGSRTRRPQVVSFGGDAVASDSAASSQRPTRQPAVAAGPSDDDPENESESVCESVAGDTQSEFDGEDDAAGAVTRAAVAGKKERTRQFEPQQGESPRATRAHARRNSNRAVGNCLSLIHI